MEKRLTPPPQSLRILRFDPQAQPALPLDIGSLLKPQSLELDFIRHAFEQPFPWQVEPLFKNLFLSSAQNVPAITTCRPAAVFMPLVQRETGLNVLFTRRAAHLSHHAGQICFPGGRIDATDDNAIAAAFRETHEEIGVPAEFIDFMGTHPDLLTSTQFIITPVVGSLKPGFTISPHDAEVAEVFEVPLNILMNPEYHRLHKVPTTQEIERYYFSMCWQSYFIWGATAALIRNFYHFLLAAQIRYS